MSFHNVLFPKGIAYGARGGPEFNTTVLMLASGYERRNINWSKVRARYNVAYGIKKPDQMDQLLEFFYARQGRAYSFLYHDHKDYKIRDQIVGVGTGSRTEFQIYKKYESGGFDYDRLITKIQPNTAQSPITARVGDSQLILNDAGPSGFTVDLLTGILELNSAPLAGQEVRLTCDFYVHVRFDTDFMDVQLLTYEAEAWSDIILIEVKEDVQ